MKLMAAWSLHGAAVEYRYPLITGFWDSVGVAAVEFKAEISFSIMVQADLRLSLLLPHILVSGPQAQVIWPRNVWICLWYQYSGTLLLSITNVYIVDFCSKTKACHFYNLAICVFLTTVCTHSELELKVLTGQMLHFHGICWNHLSILSMCRWPGAPHPQKPGLPDTHQKWSLK